MPAAELSRLRLQIDQLILIFNQPEEFSRRLHDMLNLYGNHAYRAGQAVKPQSILPSYRVPPLVTRQLVLDLGKTAQERPQETLALVDVLWKDHFLEPRLLAASLLGVLPMSAGREVIQKLRGWGRPDENLRLFNQVIEESTVRLRRERPDLLLDLIKEWIGASSPQQQAVAMRAMIPLINDPSFENLPVLYRLLAPLAQNIAPAAQTDLQVTLQALIRRSPVETAYFLRQALTLAATSSTTRLVRRCLPDFPAAQQAGLRAALEARAHADEEPLI